MLCDLVVTLAKPAKICYPIFGAVRNTGFDPATPNQATEQSAVGPDHGIGSKHHCSPATPTPRHHRGASRERQCSVEPTLGCCFA